MKHLTVVSHAKGLFGEDNNGSQPIEIIGLILGIFSALTGFLAKRGL